MYDAGEKAFEPTPQRLEKAKREGNVARSSELGSNAAFALGALAVETIAPHLQAAAAAAFGTAATGAPPWLPSAAVAGLALIPMVAAGSAAIAASFLQTGGVAFAGITVKSERLNPVEGLKRLASRETLSHGLRAAAAFAVATGAMLPALGTATLALVAAPDAEATAAAARHALERVAGASIATGLLFALGEYGMARNAWLRKLRMTFDERKREAKEQEGDPFARNRRRSLHRSFVRGAIAKVKDAAFVVVNPEHVAVAMEYRPPKVSVPRVMVRAAGNVALRVRALARLHAIPVIENAPLARALFREVRVGETIARAHYVAVAEIVIALARAKTHRS